jgi:hypothetical protein
MTVHEVTPAVDTDTLLAGAQFADAFGLRLTIVNSTPGVPLNA